MRINTVSRSGVTSGVLVAVLLVVSPIAGQQTDQPLDFDTIAKHWYSSQQEKQFLVIRSKRDWKAVWKVVNSPIGERPALPRVNFKRDLVVAVFQGEKYSGGFEITVRRITQAADGAVNIFVRETLNSGCPSAGVLTHPYHIVKLRAAAEVAFIEEAPEILDCR